MVELHLQDMSFKACLTCARYSGLTHSVRVVGLAEDAFTIIS